MKTVRKFSDVALAYNVHCSNLNDAKNIFQKEMNSLKDFVLEHLQSISGKLIPGEIQKLRFGEPEDTSTQKEGAWLNFVSGVYLPIDIRAPRAKNFKKEAAGLYFETGFDDTESRFMFRCRFENTNAVDEMLDEKLLALIKTKDQTLFTGLDAIKSNTTIVFRTDLKNEIFDNLDKRIDATLQAVQELVESTFPDAMYHAAIEEAKAAAEAEAKAEAQTAATAPTQNPIVAPPPPPPAPVTGPVAASTSMASPIPNVNGTVEKKAA